jgi:hypothetical protein
MKIGSNWKKIVMEAWSVRFMALAVVSDLAPYVLEFFEYKISPGMFRGLSMALVVLGLYARLVPQKGLSDADQ